MTDDYGQDTIFTLDKAKKWMITAHKFGTQEDPMKTDLMTILKHDTPVRAFKVLEGGAVICATTTDGFIIGKRSRSNKSLGSLKDLLYTWREVKTTEPPTCFAMRTGTVIASEKQPKRKGQASPSVAVDIIIGGLTGCVYVYHDVVNKLDMNGPPSKTVHSSSALTVREMHWHREPVGALAWSLDGKRLFRAEKSDITNSVQETMLYPEAEKQFSFYGSSIQERDSTYLISSLQSKP